MESHMFDKAWKLKVLVILAVAVTLSLGFYMYQGNESFITLQLEEEIRDLISDAETVEELLAKEGILINEKTYINMSLDTILEDNMHITIKNPKTYTFLSSDLEVDVESLYTSVEDIISDHGIVLGEKDFTYPSLDSTVSPGSIIEFFKVEEVVETIENTLPFETIVKKNNSMDVGTTKVIQDGVDGFRRIYIQKEFINGELNNTEFLKEEIVSNPVSNIIEKGTKDVILTSRGNTSYRKAITMSATAYDLSFESCGKNPGDKWYGITASGTKARPGVVAVDPKVIPLGTKLYVESLDGTKDYGFAIAEDTGGAIKGNKIDLFFESSTDVYKFGRRKVKVYIIK